MNKIVTIIAEIKSNQIKYKFMLIHVNVCIFMFIFNLHAVRIMLSQYVWTDTLSRAITCTATLFVPIATVLIERNAPDAVLVPFTYNLAPESCNTATTPTDLWFSSTVTL